jgi:cardiolipin synthase
MLHSKTMTVDDTFALLGTANLDVRSFFLNFEVNVLMYGPQITHELRFAQMAYMNDSELLTMEVWNSRASWRRYAESVAALFAPLL